MNDTKNINPGHSQPKVSESREYCFVIMSYNQEYDQIYEQLKEIVQGYTGFRCIRADREPQYGRGLLEKVHEQILGSSVVVADLSEPSPNVYYEYGYASAHNRLPILIAEQAAEIKTDLIGKEVLRYKVTPSDDEKFTIKFLEYISKVLRSPLPEQRRMLTSSYPFPAYVIAAPRVPGPTSRHSWHPSERKTFGDMLGIVGILTAYGNLFGTHNFPELLHAEYLPDDLYTRSANFFCIGSSKVNPATEYFLPKIQEGLNPCWEMLQLGPGEDKRVVFRGDLELDRLLEAEINPGQDGSMCDYGLIIRAPHPNDPHHIVLIAAGRHSIGTHTACMVITRQNLIAELEQKLKSSKIHLQNTTTPFWAIVRGKLGKDGKFSDHVEIVKTGGYEQGRSS